MLQSGASESSFEHAADLALPGILPTAEVLPAPVEPPELVPFGEVIAGMEEDCFIVDEGWKSADRLVRGAYERVVARFDDALDTAFNEEESASLTPPKGMDFRPSAHRGVRRATSRMVPRHTKTNLIQSQMYGRLMALGEVYLGDEVAVKVRAQYANRQDYLNVSRPQNAQVTNLRAQIPESALSEIDYAARETLGVDYDSYVLFLEVESANKRLIHAAGDYVRQGRGAIESFCEWLTTVQENEDGTYRSYLASLATDMHDPHSEKYLKKALQETMETGEMVFYADFVQGVLTDDAHPIHSELTAILGLMKIARGSQEEDDPSPVEVFVRNPALWPPRMLRDYEEFVSAWKQEKTNAITTILQNYRLKERRIPTDEVRAFVQEDRAPRRTLKAKPGKGGGRITTPKPRVVEVEPPAPHTLTLLKSAAEGFTTIVDEDGTRLSAMLDAYASRYQNEPGLRQALDQMIEQLTQSPKGFGTKKLTGIHVKMRNGMSVALRRFALRGQSSIASSGSTAFRTQIVYAVVDSTREVAIREVVHHRDFDPKYTRNIGA